MWAKIVAFFHDSEVIFWARLQIFVGVLLTVAAGMDWSPLAQTGIPTKQQMFYYGVLVFQGIVTEYSRRRRADDMDRH